MEKVECILQLSNSITRYYKSIKSELFGIDLNEKIDHRQLKYALLSVVILDLIYNKEKLVEKKEGLIYESKMSDNGLKNMKNILINEEDKDIFEDWPILLSFIRNKLAHGDYIIDDENNNLCLKKEDRDILINIDKFIDICIDLSKSMSYRIKENKFSKFLIIDKNKNKFDHQIKTDSDFEKYISFIRLKTYNIRRKDGKKLTTDEKTMMMIIFENIKQTCMNEKNQKCVDLAISQQIEKHGYIVDINKTKIKNPELKQKIRESIKATNKIYDSFDDIDTLMTQRQKTESLIFMYGENVYKIVSDDYNSKGIKHGIEINGTILNEMNEKKTNNLFNLLETTLKNQSREIVENIDELISGLFLVRFYVLYCYPLDNTYKTTNKYVYNRENDLPFGKFNLSDINPSILNIDTFGKEQAKIEIDSTANKIIKTNKLLKDNKKNINCLSNKEDISIKEATALENMIKKDKILSDNLIQLCYKQEKDEIKYKLIEEDYQENSNYFRNKMIIEGIRNSISHGNVTIENSGTVENWNDIILKFSDYYNGNLEFELSATLFQLEQLFEEYNTKIIESFLLKENNITIKEKSIVKVK